MPLVVFAFEVLVKLVEVVVEAVGEFFQVVFELLDVLLGVAGWVGVA